MSSNDAFTILLTIAMYAMGWSSGNWRGQMAANREHLKFLRESSARADELHRELVVATSGLATHGGNS